MAQNQDDNGQAPLNPPLPVPPHAGVRGIECVLEKVRIDHLDAWRQEHGLVFQEMIWMGEYHRWRRQDGIIGEHGLGWVSSNVPAAWLEGERE